MKFQGSSRKFNLVAQMSKCSCPSLAVALVGMLMVAAATAEGNGSTRVICLPFLEEYVLRSGFALQLFLQNQIYFL